MRSVKVDLSTIQDNIISISSGFDFSGNATLAKPVNGSISAHSFYYPDGSVHLGLDVAVPLLTPIYAPEMVLFYMPTIQFQQTAGISEIRPAILRVLEILFIC